MPSLQSRECEEGLGRGVEGDLDLSTGGRGGRGNVSRLKSGVVAEA